MSLDAGHVTPSTSFGPYTANITTRVTSTCKVHSNDKFIV